MKLDLRRTVFLQDFTNLKMPAKTLTLLKINKKPQVHLLQIHV